MRTRGPILLLCLGLAGLLACDRTGAGERYRAERHLHRADAMREELVKQAVPPSDPQWAHLGRHYENISRHLVARLDEVDVPVDSVRARIRAIAAAAGLRAVDAHGAHLDSTRAEQLLDELARTFTDDDSLASEIERRRGAVARLHGDLEAALRHYRSALEHRSRIRPACGLDSASAELPLVITQVTARLADARTDSIARRTALDCYREVLASQERPITRARVLAAMAELAAADDDWALARLHRQARLEALREAGVRGRTLEDARFEVFSATLATGPPEDSLLTMAERLSSVRERGEGPVRRRLALAQALSDRGRSAEALHLLSVAARATNDPRRLAEIAQTRAHVHERADDTMEALKAWRALQVEHPLSTEALLSHLELAEREFERGGARALQTSLAEARSAYEEFLSRYPDNESSTMARRLLITVLERQGEDERAVAELLTLANERSGTIEAALARTEAARMLTQDLGDTAAAIVQLERVAGTFPETRIGARASRRAGRLREIGRD